MTFHKVLLEQYQTLRLSTPMGVDNKPQREKTPYLLICATNEDSDQPAHPRSLISLRCPPKSSLGADVRWYVFGRCGPYEDWDQPTHPCTNHLNTA